MVSDTGNSHPSISQELQTQGKIPQVWSDVSEKPHSRESKNFRIATIKNARRPPVSDRISYLENLVRSRRVLDVGVAAHTATERNKETWLHRRLAHSSAYCLGVDILPDAINTLRLEGYNVRCCNILEEEIDEKFDVVVVGEVIEHLGSPEKLFMAARRLLLPGGRLVITSPNPYYWKWIRDNLRVQNDCCVSADHVTLLEPTGIAEFAERADMQLCSFRGVYSFRPTVMGKLGRKLMQIAGGRLVSRETFCLTLIYECEVLSARSVTMKKAG